MRAWYSRYCSLAAGVVISSGFATLSAEQEQADTIGISRRVVEQAVGGATELLALNPRTYLSTSSDQRRPYRFLFGSGSAEL